MALMIQKIWYSANPKALYVSIDAEHYSFPVRSLLVNTEGIKVIEEKFQSKYNSHCNYSVEEFMNLTYCPSGFLYQPIITGEKRILIQLEKDIKQLVEDIDLAERSAREIYKGDRR